MKWDVLSNLSGFDICLSEDWGFVFWLLKSILDNFQTMCIPFCSSGETLGYYPKGAIFSLHVVWCLWKIQITKKSLKMQGRKCTIFNYYFSLIKFSPFDLSFARVSFWLFGEILLCNGIAHLGLRYVWESYFLAFRDEPSVYHCLRRHKKSKG